MNTRRSPNSLIPTRELLPHAYFGTQGDEQGLDVSPRYGSAGRAAEDGGKRALIPYARGGGARPAPGVGRTRLPRSRPARGTTSYPAERASRPPLDGVIGSQGRGVGAAGAGAAIPRANSPAADDRFSVAAEDRLDAVAATVLIAALAAPPPRAADCRSGNAARRQHGSPSSAALLP